MNKNTSTVLISMILVLMIITISIVIKFGSHITSAIAGNGTKGATDKNILNTTVAYDNTFESSHNNYIANITHNTITNQVSYNNTQNTISVENTTSTNQTQNQNTPPQNEDEIKGIFANTGLINGLSNDNVSQVVITTDDAFESFLTLYNVSRNISGIENYMSEDYFRTKNLGIIYIPLEQGQTFEIKKLGESGEVFYINLTFSPSYSGLDRNNGMLALIEVNKNTTRLEVSY